MYKNVLEEIDRMMYGNFLSPIDDYSDLPFRLLCQKYGAVATCVPLVNSTAIARDRSKLSMVDAHSDERNIGVQVVGNDPMAIGDSCRIIAEERPFVSWLNINCGCPSVRTMSSGGGSALLAFQEKIVQSVAEIKKHVDKPVSVKIRIKNDLEDTAKLCKELERVSVDFLIIHGRTAAQGYQGNADWELIKALKGRLDVPLVGNGDITSVSQGRQMVEDGYCDSFMVARTAMGNPMLFCDSQPRGAEERFALLEEYVSLHSKYLGELPSIKDVKVKAMNFTTGMENAGAMRNLISRKETVDEILALIDDPIIG